MLIVISPAKALDFTAPERAAPVTTPEMAADIAELAVTAKKLKTGDLKRMMDLSDKLAQLNRERFQAFDPAMEDGLQAALRRELNTPAVVKGDQLVAFHAGGRLRDSGDRLPELLGYPDTERDDTLLLKLEHSAQVHLRGIDEVMVVHSGRPLPCGGCAHMPASAPPTTEAGIHP